MAIEPKCLPVCAPNAAGELPVRPDGGPTPGAAGIEIGFAPLGCTFDANGEQTGSVFTAETRADEPGSPSTYRMVHVSTAGVVTDPYLGTWEDCDRVVLDPVQFCFTGTSTGDVDHPGRQYDVTLPINPGFALESIAIDGTSHAANIVWSVGDPDGAAFAANVQSFVQARVPAGATVTVTNPNAGQVICGDADPFTLHISCVRIDQPAPNAIEFVYNGGRDLITNPSMLSTPADNSPYAFATRQDNGGALNCTNVANRGWETNDILGQFETWHTGVNPNDVWHATPRGTPVAEINANGSGAIVSGFGADPTTNWQTFVVPVAGSFRMDVVVGGRWTTQDINIRLSTGDTNAAGPGDIFNQTVSAPSVTVQGGSNPWTVVTQNVNLAAGTYTLAFTGPDADLGPGGSNSVGGLFTDMRVFSDAPGQRITATNADDCVVTTEETVSTTTCEFWQPRTSANGDIVSWRNAEDGEELTNAAFWGQVPSPECCMGAAASGGGGTVSAGNLVQFYEVCGVVGGMPQTLQRIVFTDQSGGVVAGSFIGSDGGPVTPDAGWTVGACPLARPDGVDVEVTTEPGCANGVPYTRRTIWRYNATDGSLISTTVTFVDSDGVGVAAPPDEFVLGSCIGRVRLYTSTVETVTGIFRVIAPVIPDPDPLVIPLWPLVSWSIRHRSGTVTVQSSNDDLDNPSIITMDPGEVISFDAGDDPNGAFNSPVIIDATAGSVRVTYQYRIAGTANIDIA